MAVKKATSTGADVLITLADVEPAVRLNALMEEAGFSTALVSPLDDFRAEVARLKPELIVLTGNLADLSNQQLVRDQLWDGVAVLGLADIDDPVLIDRLRSIGFVDIYTKPIPPNDLFDAVRRVLERHRLAESTGLIGQSAALREVLVRVEQMAPVSSTVLVGGESGTGKELVARAIHHLSNRRNKPFIAVNVGALPETLLESELFGHEKGAFTGAAERRIGRFELADTGTLFLDEIGEIPPSTQVKLLRVLEEREVTRVGGVTPIRVNVRVVAATNQPLAELVESGKFRSDLYYRLNVLSIYLPPLRDRREDIPLLIRRFIREFARVHDRPFRGISADAMRILVQYSWPGNVRQLRNLIESMVVLAPGREVTPEDIPVEVREGGRPTLLPVHIPSNSHGSINNDQTPELNIGGANLGNRELEFIVRSLVDLKMQVEELRQRLDSGGDRIERHGRSSEAPVVIGKHQNQSVLRDIKELNSLVSHSAPDFGPDFSINDESVPVDFEAIRPPGTGEDEYSGFTVKPGMTMAEIEKAAILSAVKANGGNRRKAAQALGIGERTMYRKLRDYDIPLEDSDVKTSAVSGSERSARDDSDSGDDSRSGNDSDSGGDSKSGDGSDFGDGSDAKDT